MNLIEITGVLTGALSVWLAARLDWLTWPVGLVNVLCFIVLFSHAGLYPDVGLHIIYLGLSIYGWVKWDDRQDELKVTSEVDTWQAWQHSAMSLYIGWSIPIIAATVSIGSLFYVFTNASYPYLDSFVTVMSILGCYLLSRKIIECWIIYIISDIVAIGIYTAKGLPWVAALYGLYLVLCIKGYREWRRAL